MKRWTERRGIAVPVEPEQPRRTETFLNTALVESQLARFIQMVLDEGGTIQSVTLEPGMLENGRYTIVYRHTRQFEVETYT